jgi:S-adenosylmethionine:tRNA ribosyltransferase-isomerase
MATGRIVAGTRLRIVDALLTGAHEPGTSHHALLGAFLDQTMLRRVDAELAANHYRTHEFGDSVLMERGVGSRRFADRPRRAEKIA